MDVEQRARELLAAQCEIDGMPEAAKMVRAGTFKGDAADGFQTTIRAIIAALTPPEGHVVVTRNEAGQAVAVTRQDDEGRILSVIAEFEPMKSDMGNPISVPEGYVLVPVEPTDGILTALYGGSIDMSDDELRVHWANVLAACREVPDGRG